MRSRYAGLRTIFRLRVATRDENQRNIPAHRVTYRENSTLTHQIKESWSTELQHGFREVNEHVIIDQSYWRESRKGVSYR